MEIKRDEGVEVVKRASPGLPLRILLRCRNFWTGVAVIPTFVLVFFVLATVGLFMETRTISCVSEVPVLFKEETCSPKTVSPNVSEYHSGHRYYSALKEMGPLPAPTFRGEHTQLCEEELRRKVKYSYCLPISGRKDTPFCTAGDRTDPLSAHSVCYASVLHMLLVEVYEELEATGNTPLITFGSLLGAVRNGSMIPFTEDTDIGFVGKLKAKGDLQEALWRKGYHMFFLNIWRVCVAPTHPLASRLYDPNLPLTRNFAVPYVDLYQIKRLNNGNWDIEELQGSNGRLMPYDKVEPFSQVTINGMPFDTVHDPDFFLREAYGPNYMTPKPRRAPAAKPKITEAAKNTTKTKK
ncbi:hypothetical protein PF005_g4385 [Phytophthora fragariae]|uniref:LicD family protein n=1 Tax=Phytophthora fragariae TaxID=53985 RepID=A0A6A3U926_9STRA|nr:hypothetical protein PF003_g3082 [Phytophthora fragariae]KAE8949519.1 hypothetical protein PF009_g918 [Phytophthora fragariae]KAE9014104.1 hypothetical protein PF011_g8202 [Phytophthora fragariae]KAE9117435.1 hypothetical protein PF010_g8596 [Phytophthora fragariae]KAE9130638.1 hypothetical protein PF007_g4418 [Phytophthora fragariae]